MIKIILNSASINKYSSADQHFTNCFVAHLTANVIDGLAVS